jgi:hypothetical protein
MQISKSALSFFLLCQAFQTLEAVTLVRSSAKSVSADGTVLDESPAGILPNGDEVDASLMESRSATAEDLLAQIQTLVKSKAKGDRDQIPEIQKLAKELLAEVVDDRDKEAKEVPINLKAVDDCNSGSTSRQQGIKTSTEKTVGTSRDTHATCRAGEKEKEEHKNGRCGELDTYLAAVKDGSPKPTGRDAMVKWVEDESAYYCPKGPEATAKDEACKTAEKEHAEHKADCDKKQASFELGFCTWRTELVQECKELSTCYTDAVENYNKHVTITKELVEKLKTEYKALKKILCYVDVWMNDDNTKTVDASQYSKCQAEDPTDEANQKLDIDYGKVAAKVTCDTASVQTYPGTPEFPTKEYAAFSKYAVTPIACLGQEAETTTTAEPQTTTTAEPMTTMQEIDGKWSIVHVCTHCGNRGSTWKRNTMTAESCQEKCQADGKSLLIYNHAYYNCRCYDQSDCVEDNRVQSSSYSCTHNIYAQS